MRAALVTAICALALSSSACTEKSPGPASASCGAGETANASPPFCFKLPAGFSPRGEPVKRQGWVDFAFSSEDKSTIHFIVRDLDSFDRTWKALTGNAAASKAADVKEEEFAGGKGKILTYTTPEKDPRFVISALYRGAKNVLECETEYRMSAPRPELLDACKSLREP